MREGMFIEGLKELIRQLDKAANGELKKEFALWLEAMGFQFLEEVQREIINLEVVDTRRLLNSFDKGTGDGIWKISSGGLTLEVGTNLQYAQAVNDGYRNIQEGKGYWNIKDASKKTRWVPGVWSGGKFTYEKTAKTGMLIKRKFITDRRWIPGKWEGNRFIYDKNAKTGMLLKAKWIDGKHYWDKALAIFEKMFEKSLEKKLQQWLDTYFA